MLITGSGEPPGLRMVDVIDIVSAARSRLTPLEPCGNVQESTIFWSVWAKTDDGSALERRNAAKINTNFLDIFAPLYQSEDLFRRASLELCSWRTFGCAGFRYNASLTNPGNRSL